MVEHCAWHVAYRAAVSEPLEAIKGTGNREQRIRISTYQKLCIPCVLQYIISDRLKFLFSVLCSLFLLLYGAPKRRMNCGEQ